MDPRRPVIPMGVEEDEKHALVFRNGEVRAAANVILSPDDAGRVRAGYVCANCFEAQETPFPKECWVCKFPMADRQAEYVAKAYQGNVRMGPQVSLADELAAMEELEARKKLEEWGQSSSIIVPGSW